MVLNFSKKIFKYFFSMVWGQVMFHNSDGPTNQPTDRRTDRPSYRDAWTHLKKDNHRAKKWIRYLFYKNV